MIIISLISTAFAYPVTNNSDSSFSVSRSGTELIHSATKARFNFASYNIPNLLLLEGVNSYNRVQPWENCDMVSDICTNGYVCCIGVQDVAGNKSTCRPKGECSGNSTFKAESGDWIIPSPEEQESAILDIVGSSGRVARTYTLGFGPFYHMEAPGKYYEPAWVAMDHAIALARKHGVKLIIPIVNNHWDGDGSSNLAFGDYGWLSKFRGLLPSAFFTDARVIADFKDLLTFMLQRINTVNGIR